MSRRHISWKKDGDSNQCFCIRLTAYGSSTQTQRAILASGDVIYMHGQSFFFFFFNGILKFLSSLIYFFIQTETVW